MSREVLKLLVAFCLMTSGVIGLFMDSADAAIWLVGGVILAWMSHDE